MSQKLKALIVQHEEPTPPGLLLEWLLKHEFSVDILRIDIEARVPPATSYDLIASLGSDYSAYDETVPFVHLESALIREAVSADVPCLGLCFGGQLMAHALGGRSFRAQRPEIGWRAIRSRDPLLIDEGPWFEWHVDTFSLPPGSTLLAETDVGPQAYVIGRSLGLQFHPEATPEIVETWVRGGRRQLEASGVDSDQLLDETNRSAADVRHRSELLFSRFVGSIAKLNA